MAVVAVASTRYVGRMLARCRDAVMTGAASAEHLCMVHCDRGLECRRAVAVFADIACLQMSRTLSGSARAIVAADAVSDNTGVIENRGEPGGNVMAVVALVTR